MTIYHGEVPFKPCFMIKVGKVVCSLSSSRGLKVNGGLDMEGNGEQTKDF